MTHLNEMERLIKAFDNLLLEYRTRARTWPDERPEPVEDQPVRTSGITRTAAVRRAASTIKRRRYALDIVPDGE